MHSIFRKSNDGGTHLPYLRLIGDDFFCRRIAREAAFCPRSLNQRVTNILQLSVICPII